MSGEDRPVDVRLVDADWERELREGLSICSGVWRLACPFIKLPVIDRLLARATLQNVQVVTRFSLTDFASGVSDIEALRAIVRAGGEVRGLRNLHSKVFVFGTRRAAVTSANLTNAALDRNAEFGCVSDDPDFVTACGDYIQVLWDRSVGVTLEQLDEWQATVGGLLLGGGRPDLLVALPDYGANAREPWSVLIGGRPVATGGESGWPVESTRAHVKFSGEGDNRLPADTQTLDEVIESGSYYACCYPTNRRPRAVQAGDTMFIGRLTHSPNDTLIYGRAIAVREHDDEHDNATQEEIAQARWKAEWPRYIRVHHAEFIAGRLGDGISLNALMGELRADSFLITQKHHRLGNGNTNPRRALIRQPAIELTTEAFTWLTENFERALTIHGSVPPAELEGQYWPSNRTTT